MPNITYTHLMLGNMSFLEIDFSKDEEDILLSLFNTYNYNQFYFHIMKNVLLVKRFSINHESLFAITEALALNVDRKNLKIHSDFDILNYSKTLYSFFLSSNIKYS